MSYPVGEISCKLDSKGRLMMPSEFKEQLGEEAEAGFVMRPGLFNKCLDLYTRKDWDEVQAKFHASLNAFDPKDVAVMRKFNAGARFAKLDASGRLQIPKELMDKGYVVKEVVITSATTKMEIWDKTLYEEALNSIDDELYLEILKDKLK